MSTNNSSYPAYRDEGRYSNTNANMSNNSTTSTPTDESATQTRSLNSSSPSRCTNPKCSYSLHATLTSRTPTTGQATVNGTPVPVRTPADPTIQINLYKVNPFRT
eukprot:CAMPEP_0116904366 /NCGR_PEP_ID=MMETSP0467-20121206/11380_1 /TAXON_ID=283647 /ORGANISM="Mesodinium pulex, Strain SPMC105" /LENGTH=104 /DNA_ID=CAMNT_0004579005 /DNA_START=157 /DNA_END=472 /DNA_ORIENTATION=-